MISKTSAINFDEQDISIIRCNTCQILMQAAMAQNFSRVSKCEILKVWQRGNYDIRVSSFTTSISFTQSNTHIQKIFPLYNHGAKREEIRLDSNIIHSSPTFSRFCLPKKRNSILGENKQRRAFVCSGGCQSPSVPRGRFPPLNSPFTASNWQIPIVKKAKGEKDEWCEKKCASKPLG